MATLLRESLRGATRPRILVVPPTTVDTFGPEAAELSAQAGLKLDPWQCDGLDVMLGIRADGKWACFEYCELCSRQNGKTTGLFAPRALFGFLMLGEPLIMWSAHEYKTAMESFRLFRRLIYALGRPVKPNLVAIEIDGSDVPVKISNTNGEEMFERLDTEARVKFIARSKSAGRGFTGNINLVDESFALTEAQKEAFGPTMLAVPNPQVIYASSPPLDGVSGDALFDLRKRALAGGDDSLAYRDWGLEGDLDELHLIDLDDRSNWERTNPSLGFRLTEESIGRLRRMLSDRGFGRECMGVWPKRVESGGAIDVARWASMVDSLSRRDGAVGIGLDITPTRDFAAIALYGTRPDGVGHGQLVDYRAGTEWILPRLAELCAALKPVAVGMGSATYRSLKPDLAKAGLELPEKPDEPQRGDLAVAGGVDMSAACGQMIDATRQANFRHIGQPQLDTAVSGAQTRLVGDTIAWSRKDATTDICPLVALTVARWAFLARVDALAVAPATARAATEVPDPRELWRPTARLGI